VHHVIDQHRLTNGYSAISMSGPQVGTQQVRDDAMIIIALVSAPMGLSRDLTPDRTGPSKC
jgi:hypothetical protein